MLCPFFPALSRLVAVPLMVWQLSTFLAETSCDAARRQTAGDLLILLTFAISLWFVQMPWVRIMLLVILACLLFYMWQIPVIDEKQEKH